MTREAGAGAGANTEETSPVSSPLSSASLLVGENVVLFALKDDRLKVVGRVRDPVVVDSRANHLCSVFCISSGQPMFPGKMTLPNSHNLVFFFH